MKRSDLIRHLQKHGCVLLREGSKHSLCLNPLAQRDFQDPDPLEA